MSFDRAIQREWFGIKIGMTGAKGKIFSKVNQRENARWKALGEGWIKVNFKGGRKG